MYWRNTKMIDHTAMVMASNITAAPVPNRHSKHFKQASKSQRCTSRHCIGLS